jgi:type I restriction enzyme R subunit
MSRRICIDLLNAIIKLRPEWASAVGDNETEEAGKKHVVKIVMTGSATDELSWQPHIRNKQARGELALRFKDPSDPFSIVIVRDMWLTGFDAPCLSTMYIDKPMRGHSLMQAIARVNRVFKDKPGGLVVDYLGLADQLKSALATYTAGGGRGSTTETTETAVRVLAEKCEVASAMLHGFDWSAWHTGSALARLQLLPGVQEHLLAQDEGKKRFTTTTAEISRAFALCATRPEAIALRDDISFFQAVSAALKKTDVGNSPNSDLDHAIQQLVSSALAEPGEIIDVFAAAGLKRPDISILSEEFLKEVAGMKHKNLAAEVLAKLLAGEIKTRSSRNVVQGRAFSEMLKKTLNAYHNRAIATQEVIDELIRLAREIDQARRRGQILNLTDEELAFYDALAANESAAKTMGNKELQVIATELVSSVRKSVTIDWTLRENARAKIRVIVKRILSKYGYPPDLQDEAVQTVLQQAEVLCKDWAA